MSKNRDRTRKRWLVRVVPLMALALLYGLVSGSPAAAIDRLPTPEPTVAATGFVGEAVSFDWERSSGAASFDLVLTRNDSNFQNTSVSASEFVRSFTTAGVYCLSVTALPSAGSTKHVKSAASDPVCTTISERTTPRLDRPNPSVAEPNADVGDTVTFTWPSVARAGGYNVRVERDGVAFDEAWTVSPLYAPVFSSPGEYCVFVTAAPADSLADRPSAESNPACVRVSEEVVPRRQLDRPVVSVVSSSKVGDAVRFSWGDVVEAAEYSLRLDRDGEYAWNGKVVDEELRRTLRRPGRFCLFVRALPADGDDSLEPSQRSKAACVRVSEEVVPRRQLDRPVVSVVSSSKVGDAVRFSWGDVVGAAEYSLRLDRDGEYAWNGKVVDEELRRTLRRPGRFCLFVRALPADGDDSLEPSQRSKAACVTVTQPQCWEDDAGLAAVLSTYKIQWATCLTAEQMNERESAGSDPWKAGTLVAQVRFDEPVEFVRFHDQSDVPNRRWHMRHEDVAGKRLETVRNRFAILDEWSQMLWISELRAAPREYTFTVGYAGPQESRRGNGIQFAADRVKKDDYSTPLYRPTAESHNRDRIPADLDQELDSAGELNFTRWEGPCDRGDEQSCMTLCLAGHSRFCDDAPETAIQTFEQACDAGDREACFTMCHLGFATDCRQPDTLPLGPSFRVWLNCGADNRMGDAWLVEPFPEASHEVFGSYDAETGHLFVSMSRLRSDTNCTNASFAVHSVAIPFGLVNVYCKDASIGLDLSSIFGAVAPGARRLPRVPRFQSEGAATVADVLLSDSAPSVLSFHVGLGVVHSESTRTGYQSESIIMPEGVGHASVPYCLQFDVWGGGVHTRYAIGFQADGSTPNWPFRDPNGNPVGAPS